MKKTFNQLIKVIVNFKNTAIKNIDNVKMKIAIIETRTQIISHFHKKYTGIHTVMHIGTWHMLHLL